MWGLSSILSLFRNEINKLAAKGIYVIIGDFLSFVAI